RTIEMCGCELREDGSKGGHWQFAYDGRDFLAFDKETLTWTAADAQAQVTKRKWDAGKADNCRIAERNLFLFAESPEMKVTSRADYGNIETLICRADGFYPKYIETVWIRDGEVWEQETLRGLVAPNSDGTYHTWISTKINPKDKGRFQCRVDHASWKDPVDFAVEEPVNILQFFLSHFLIFCLYFSKHDYICLIPYYLYFSLCIPPDIVLNPSFNPINCCVLFVPPNFMH
uniref:Ig-like domain-containing protein n=1 Tax=Salvator merianae TaxID=96440 RepID=A0A8D0B3Z8_SALMN